MSATDSETFAIYKNFRNAAGGVDPDDIEQLVNIRVRKSDGRLLVETDFGRVASIEPHEVTAVDTGTAVTFGSSIVWFNMINDDSADNIYLRLGSVVASTNTVLAFKVKPGEGLDISVQRLVSNTSELVLTTLPGKTAVARLGIGL